MKRILKRALLAVPVIACYLMFGFHACLIAGCGSTDSSGNGGGAKIAKKITYLQVSQVNPAEGSDREGASKIILTTKGVIPAGTQLILACTSPDCKLISVNGSTDSTGPGGGGPKRFLIGTIPYTIPENTELELKIIPKGDPAKSDSSQINH